MKTRAAVHYTDTPLLALSELTLDEPQDNEVLVHITATGICHTDIAVINDQIPVPSPVVPGHEGAGVVLRTGKKVTHVQPGDHVVLTLASCGHCHPCTTGRPTYCAEHQALNWQAARADGSVSLRDGSHAVHSHFFGQSSFSQYVVADASGVIKVPADAPLRFLGPFACGFMTGAGAVLNSLSPEAGSSLAVFGTGAVEMAAIMAARIAGCEPVIAVDINNERLSAAADAGATHCINPAETDLMTEINRITQGRGVNYSVESAGHPGVMKNAVQVLAEQGSCVLTGVVAADAVLPVDIMHLIRGRTVKGSIMGDAEPSVFIPELVNLFLQGKFPADKFIQFYSFGDINKAIEDSRSGKCIKAVIEM